jgi:UMP-CMP kinase
MCKNWNFAHLSAGELLRNEAHESSKYGTLIAKYLQEGEIVPLEITIGLLQNKMQEYIEQPEEGKSCFLIDGFPRKMDQALAFQETVCFLFISLLFHDCELIGGVGC